MISKEELCATNKIGPVVSKRAPGLYFLILHNCNPQWANDLIFKMQLSLICNILFCLLYILQMVQSEDGLMNHLGEVL